MKPIFSPIHAAGWWSAGVSPAVFGVPPKTSRRLVGPAIGEPPRVQGALWRYLVLKSYCYICTSCRVPEERHGEACLHLKPAFFLLAFASCDYRAVRFVD